MTELTAEQRRAVETERNVLITAGAGTGKTRTMTERIIRKLDEIDHIQQLLVVTFTEDAASEVRHRVYGALLEQIRTGDPSRREHFERIRDQFPNHHISTMHTFFAALLRQHGHRLSEEDGGRVEPDFVILEGAEQRALLRDSVESVLDEAAQNRHSPLREPLALWLRSGVRRSQLCAAVEAIISRRIELRSWLEKARSLSFEALFQAHEAWGRALLKRLQAAFFSDSEVVQLLEHIRTCAPASDANDRLAKLREAVLRAFQEENPAGLLECLLTKQQRPRSFGNVGSQRNWDPEVLETLRGALTRLARRVEEEQSLRWDWDPSLESEAMALARALALLAEAALEQYRARKLARHLVDFVDLEDFAGRLVRQPEVRRLLHRQFRAIFIDEFQDTNRHQWGTFRAIAADPRTEKIPPGRLFLVGDEKQAIYEFRGGEVEVCRIAGQEVEEQLEFTVNFRSGSNLLLFTNAFFDRLLTGEAPYEARPQALAHREDRQPPVRFRPGEGTVVHWVLPVEGSRVGRQELRREARWIARHLREILDGAHSERYPGIAERARSGEPTIGILLRRSTHQRLYEDALRAYGVPFVAARGRGFFQRQEVRDLRNALIFLNDPEDDLALVGLLRSPLFGCSDLGLIRLRMAQEELGTLNFWDTLLRLEERGPSELEARFGEDAPAIYKAVVLLRRWQDRVGRKGIGLLLAQIVAETGLVAALSARPNGQQEVLNVEKFIDLAREFEAGAFPTLADFLLYLESQDAGDEEGDADLPEGGAVQILTVHRAKGLEWDLVVVPDTAGEFQTRVEERDAYGGRFSTARIAIGALTFNGEEEDKSYTVAVLGARSRERKPLLWNYLQEVQRRRILAEQRRLLYVAFTRARRALLFTSVRRAERLPESLDRASCWSDWIQLILSDSKLRACCEPFLIEEEIAEETDQQGLSVPSQIQEPVPFRQEDLRPLRPKQETVLITEPPVEAQHLAFYPYSSDLPFLIASGEAERVQEQVLNVLIPQAWEGAELSQLQTLAESIADRFDAILDRGSCRRLSLAALQAARWLHEQLGDRKPAVLWNRPFRMAVDRQQIYAGQVDLLVQGAEGWTAIDWRYGSQKDAARWDVSLYRLQLERLQRAAQQVLRCPRLVAGIVLVDPEGSFCWLTVPEGRFLFL